MWGQVSINKALRAFLSGRTVKVVDFNAETVLSLAEVLERFSEGVAFFTETVATENLEFSEAVEEMTAASPLNDGAIRGTVTIAENGDIHITRAQPVSTVHGLVEDCAAPDPEQNDIEEGQKVEYKAKNRNNKTVEDVEREYQSRKITDIGKLKACRAAGWTLKKLADEFQCSTQTVRNALTREGIE